MDPLATELALLAYIHYWPWVISANDATSLFLDVQRSLPRIVDVLTGEIGQLGDIRLDEDAVHIHLLPDEAGVEALHLVAEKPGAGALHPADRGNRQLKVEHVLVEEIFPQDPGDPEIPSGKEHSDALPSHEVGPAILAALSDDGVDPGVPCLALLPVG